MILNSKNNNFIFRYPKNFFTKEIEEKYSTYLKTQPTPYKQLSHYVNASIQKVSLPSLSINNQTQEQTSDPFKLKSRGGQTFPHFLSREIKVTHKHVEGFINYFAFYESILFFNSYQLDQKILPDCDIIILNNENKETVRYRFKGIIYKGLSETLDLDYSSVRNIPKTFTVEYEYNSLDLIFNLDGQQKIYSPKGNP